MKSKKKYFLNFGRANSNFICSIYQCGGEFFCLFKYFIRNTGIRFLEETDFFLNLFLRILPEAFCNSMPVSRISWFCSAGCLRPYSIWLFVHAGSQLPSLAKRFSVKLCFCAIDCAIAMYCTSMLLTSLNLQAAMTVQIFFAGCFMQDC